jgi:hypothetical protein
MVDCCVSGGESAWQKTAHSEARLTIDREAGCWTIGRIHVSEAHSPFQQQPLDLLHRYAFKSQKKTTKLG